MNGLTLRINRGGDKKVKNFIGFSPISIPSELYQRFVLELNQDFCQDFQKSASADEQLAILKNFLFVFEIHYNINIVNFLVIVFLEAEIKHPIKCFIVRYITRNEAYQKPFAEILASQIEHYTTKKHTSYKDYANVVSKVAMSVENFSTGVAAVKIIGIILAEYLKSCLEFCVKILRQITLSPTEKNEIFNLIHSALRLLLQIIQKVNKEDASKLTLMFNDIRVSIDKLLFDEDVPMDTKSVCGIVLITMHVSENGIDSWIDIFQPSDTKLNGFLVNDAGQLCLYSAVVTVVPIQQLQTHTINGSPVIIEMTAKIMAIGERCSSESTIVLGVTRTIVQISKSLDKTVNTELGLRVVEHLLVFIWSHLDHHMDSVRHLTAQALSCVVRYFAKLRTVSQDDPSAGFPKALDNLFTALTSLDKSRKSYYVTVTSLAMEMGALCIMEKLPDVIRDVINALSVQAVQASAATTLEILLQKHSQETTNKLIYKVWIEPILAYVATHTLDSGVLNILENLLSKAIKLDEGIIHYILAYIQRYSDLNTTSSQSDLKRILILLSVVRKAGVGNTRSMQTSGGQWKGIIAYDVLEAAAVDAMEETRILSLSLIVESHKSTEVFTTEELNFVLYYLKYNINAQSPNFRQLTLSMMKKFIKRLEDSYKVFLKRKLPNCEKNKVDYYLEFVEKFREKCFDSLVQGANYSRRFVALQLLTWSEQINLDGYKRIWKEVYVEKLLLHLEDSYENNKAFALEVLNKCPSEFIKAKKYSISLDTEDIFRQASSVKPTDCISAAYKLELLRNKLPENILEVKPCEVHERVWFALVQRLHVALRSELATCRRSVVAAARHAPLYGLLHCMIRAMEKVDAQAISEDENWSALVEDMINTSMEVNASVACVVNNSSPEGHLPMDMGGIVVTDEGNSGGLRLDDGRPVTAQMVLLCAWRTVKEVSILLGTISSRLSIAGEGQTSGTLSQGQLVRIGEHFTKLLAETKHRGAFEQAYVGFTKLLARLWRCRSSSLHELPRNWLSELMQAISSDEKRSTLCATRRSAGLPFMIQALVTTELQVQGNPKCFHHCMGTLLNLARQSGSVETRTHAVNILRALFRHSALHEAAALHVGEGLITALQGFDGDTWMERNSCTLLFSALVTRIFGVTRTRDADKLCLRNTMTGRIFFLRYPRLYDYMLDKLRVNSTEDTNVLRPSLYPVLLLLARLYPSSLEGTVSNLKLVAYIPYVLSCGGSGVLQTRRLAAKAMLPLVSPQQYVPHLEAMLTLICDQKIKRNYCHGILLQLTRLLDAKPEKLSIDKESTSRILKYIQNTEWILKQTLGSNPCYLLADEYVKVVNLLIWRFASFINDEILKNIENDLVTLLFNNKNMSEISPGREICLSNALYLYFIILNKYQRGNIPELIIKGLSHDSYEVILVTLNYLLILYKQFDPENKFHEHLSFIANENILKELKNNKTYTKLLCNILKINKYLECIQKTLKVLTLEDNTQKAIVEVKTSDENVVITDEVIINSLFDFIENEHENLTHIYLASLSNFISMKLEDSKVSKCVILRVLKLMFHCSSSDNGEETRRVVVQFLEGNYELLFQFDLGQFSKQEAFTYKATLWATLVVILEDDDDTLRQRASNIVVNLSQKYGEPTSNVISSKSAETLRSLIAKFEEVDAAIAIYVLLALLDFKSEVCITDEVNDECRVFDQNERYNIFLEETLWTSECADHIVKLYNNRVTNIIDFVKNLIEKSTFKDAFQELCNNNIIVFEQMLKVRQKEETIKRNNIVNPKIKLFVDKLCM